MRPDRDAGRKAYAVHDTHPGAYAEVVENAVLPLLFLFLILFFLFLLLLGLVVLGRFFRFDDFGCGFWSFRLLGGEVCRGTHCKGSDEQQ